MIYIYIIYDILNNIYYISSTHLCIYGMAVKSLFNYLIIFISLEKQAKDI